MALRTMKPRLVVADTRRVKAAAKTADPFYHSAEHRAWREAVLERAGYRCEAVAGGARCIKAEPHHRMFADHIVERKDGGAPFDVANGQCLCGAHHSAKTAAARGQRRGR